MLGNSLAPTSMVHQQQPQQQLRPQVDLQQLIMVCLFLCLVTISNSRTVFARKLFAQESNRTKESE
jgi:hypothetical protein